MKKNSLIFVFHLIGSFYLIKTSQIEKFVLILLLQGIFIFFEYKNSKGDVFNTKNYFWFIFINILYDVGNLFYIFKYYFISLSYFKRKEIWDILFSIYFCIFYIIWSNNIHRRFKNLYEFRWVLLFYLLYLFIFVMFLIKKEYRTKESTYWYK